MMWEATRHCSGRRRPRRSPAPCASSGSGVSNEGSGHRRRRRAARRAADGGDAAPGRDRGAGLPGPGPHRRPDSDLVGAVLGDGRHRGLGGAPQHPAQRLHRPRPGRAPGLPDGRRAGRAPQLPVRRQLGAAGDRLVRRPAVRRAEPGHLQLLRPRLRPRRRLGRARRGARADRGRLRRLVRLPRRPGRDRAPARRRPRVRRGRGAGRPPRRRTGHRPVVAAGLRRRGLDRRRGDRPRPRRRRRPRRRLGRGAHRVDRRLRPGDRGRRRLRRAAARRRRPARVPGIGLGDDVAGLELEGRGFEAVPH